MGAPVGLLDVRTLMVHLSYITCSSWSYPFFLDVQALLICGGVYNFQNGSRPKASNKCYLLDRYSSRLFATMSEERAFAASLTYENSLWITGGLDYGQDYDNFRPFSSTEYIMKNGESVKGPELPLGLAAHTIIGINSTFSMLIGGETFDIDGGTSVNLTYYFDHYNQIMFEGPRLNIARSYHGAGIVTDLTTGERLTIVTGGERFYYELRQTDFFDSTEILIDGKWILGKKKAGTFTLSAC